MPMEERSRLPSRADGAACRSTRRHNRAGQVAWRRSFLPARRLPPARRPFSARSWASNRQLSGRKPSHECGNGVRGGEILGHEFFHGKRNRKFFFEKSNQIEDFNRIEKAIFDNRRVSADL